LATRKPLEGLEVSSEQLKSELVEIKERIAALETIASLSNRAVVEKYVGECIKSPQAQKIMRACETAKTKERLVKELNFESPQALDHHLKPLRENDLLQQNFNSGKLLTFEWSNLFRRLPKASVNKLLGISKK
jgi:hypothetical protein